MKKLIVGLLFSCSGIFLSAQTPAIRSVNGVLNAASFAQQGMPNSGIAQGALFTIFGTNLGPAALQEITDFGLNSPLGGTVVNITAGGNTVPAPMIFTVAGQVAAIMPSTTPVGAATVSVTFGGNTSAEYPIQVVANSFGAFSLNQQGTGAGVFSDVNFKPFLPNYSAMPDDVVIAWGTGLGALPYPDTNHPVGTNLTNIPVKLYVGEQLVATDYQGPSGCCEGINQIVFHVPHGVTGCNVPVEVSINGVVSPTTTIPITTDASRICSDPNGISSSVWTALFSKASFNLGFLSLDRTTETLPVLGAQTSDNGSAGFFHVDTQSFVGTPSLQVAAIGSCVVTVYSGDSVSVFPTFTGLDAGPFINLQGPNGAKQLAPVSGQKGDYSADLTGGYLIPGAYTASGTGGADVGAFSANLTAPPPLVWTNEASITNVDRATGVTVTWTGGAPGTFAKITGFSALVGPPAVVALFTCEAPVAQGTFTVGPNVLLQLPPSAIIDGFGTGLLSVGNSSAPTTFAAPGIDFGYATSSVTSSSFVGYE